MDEHVLRKPLDAELPELKILEGLRSQAATMASDGVAALSELIRGVVAKGTYSNEGLIHRAVACRVAVEHRCSEIAANLRELLAATTLATLESDKFGVLTCAQVLRAALASPGQALSEPALASCYLIFHEFYRTSQNDPVVGAARVGELSTRSAYVTSEALVALLALWRSLSNTAAYFEAIAELEDRLIELDSTDINAQWRVIEEGRLFASARISLELLRPQIALDLQSLPDSRSGMGDCLKRLAKDVGEQLSAARGTLESVVAEIRDGRVTKFPHDHHRRRSTDAPIVDPAEAAKAGATVRHASETSHGYSVGIEILERLTAFTLVAIERARTGQWRPIAADFRLVAKDLHDRLRPTQAYLSTVIDRQIAARLTSQQSVWDPAELAFAAFGYSRLETPREQDRTRLQLAARYVAESIGADGHTHPRRPFFRTQTTSMQASSAFCLAAWSHLTVLAAEPLSVADAKKLIPFFEDRRKLQPVTKQTLGWISEAAADLDADPSLFSTAMAVDTLKCIELILGNIVNARIFPHFTVRRPSVPSLDELFYPDYGLSATGLADKSAGLPRHSVGIELQRMRAHIVGAERVERLTSIVLHGPAGTGKTTLAESLAVTCGVPLVEVTPSDISQAGTDGVEGRARVVFEALGLLTDAVILFDEFDPLLQRRSDDGRGERNIFMFLTPGMLPKLKLLHDRAADRRVAYVLNTNLIGSLDEAAVRQGRFDRKVGLYPPDVLSRLGRMQILRKRAAVELTARGISVPPADNSRLGEFVVHTGGLGMTALAKGGWFSLNRRKLDSLASTPLGYVLGLSNEPPNGYPEPEDTLTGLRGKGQAAEREYAQWSLVHDWDQSVRDVHKRAQHDFYKNLEADIARCLSNDFVRRK
jgi:hypothetical protein